jgi:anti-sigma B factor antagonist
MIVEIDLHADPINREQVFRRYLRRGLDLASTEELEAHYLSCDDCFEQLRTTELLIYGLDQISVEHDRSKNVAIVRFLRPSELTSTSLDTAALVQTIVPQKDTRVLIDLTNVSRIDSTGLGKLMACYCHTVKNRGLLKLLNPNAHVKRVITLAKVDNVLQMIDNEQQALESFND